jgi:hypothetical protein
VGFFLSALAGYGQHVVFTMVTPGSCPVVISSVSSSRDYGFQSLTLLNDSDKGIASILFRVTMNGEVVDGGQVFAMLEPGEKKTIDVFLGRMTALTQRARELKLGVARAIVTVESVDYTDGAQWTEDRRGDVPLLDQPVRPAPLPK